MFRKMRRARQELGYGDCMHILEEGRRGVLSVHGEDGYPYGVPMDYLFADGKLFFHGAKEGHKIDALRADPRACFTVMTEGVPVPGRVGPDVESVICFGRIAFLEPDERTEGYLRQLGCRYDPADYVEDEIARTRSRVQMLEFTIDHMSGKCVNES